MGAGPLDQYQAHSNLRSVTFKPVDVELKITPEPAVECPIAQQEAPPPNGAEPSPAQQETSAKPQSLLQRLSLLQENRNNQLSLLSLTGKLNLLQPRRRPQLSLQGPLNETESSTQQETPANFPEKVEPSAILQE